MNLLRSLSRKPATSQVAYRYKNNSKLSLRHSSAYDGEASALPASLVISPAHYEADGLFYDLREPGVYKFYSLGKLSEQRLVRGLKLEETLAALQWIFAYGNEDDKVSKSKLNEKILHQRLFITCTNIAFIAARILEECGFTARPVQLLTLEPWNYYDDGHTLLEIKDASGEWVLYDSTFYAFFLSAQKKLNAYSFCQDLKSGKEYSLNLVAKNAVIGKFASEGYDFGFWVEYRMNNESALRDWYRRMAGIPAIFDNGKWWFTSDSEAKEVVERYRKTCHFLKPDEFLKRFYSQGL